MLLLQIPFFLSVSRFLDIMHKIQYNIYYEIPTRSSGMILYYNTLNIPYFVYIPFTENLNY